MRSLVVYSILALSTSVAGAAPDAAAAREAAERLEQDARTSKDPAAYDACGAAYLAIYNADPKAPGADEVLYNASVCYEQGRSVGTAIQLLLQLQRSHASSKLGVRALGRLARLYGDAGQLALAADKAEEYARKYSGEKDAPDALSDALRYRAALGDRTRQIALTKWFSKTFGAKRAREAAEAMVELTSAYDAAPAEQLKHLRDVVRTHGNKLDRSRLAHVQLKLGELEWRQSCPVREVDGLCITVERVKASDTRCPQAPAVRWKLVRRKPASKQALATFAQVVKLATAEQDPVSTYVRARAHLYQADAELEAHLTRSFPQNLDFNAERKDVRDRSTKAFNTWIAEYQKAAAAVTRRYEAVLAIRDAVTSVAAAARLAQIAQQFAHEILGAAIPKDIGRGELAADKRAAYCAAMTDHSEPLLARAWEAFGVCARKAAELGVHDDRSQLCRREAAAADPTLALPERLAEPSVESLPPLLAAPLAAVRTPPALSAAMKQFAAAEQAGWTDGTCRRVADVFTALARKQPKLADASYMAGVSYHRCNLASDARRAYEAALAAAPDHPDARTNLGVLSWQAGDRKLARAAWDQVLVKHGKHVAARSNVAQALWQQWRTQLGDRKLDDDVRFHASAAMAVSPDAAGPRLVMAASQLELPARHGIARLFVDEALQRDGKQAAAYMVRGVLAVRRGAWVAGLADLERALELDDRLEPAQLALGLALLRVGRSDDARKALAAVKTPSYDLLVARGVAARRLGDHPAAAAAYQAAIQLDGSRADAYFDAGLLDEDFVAPAEKTPAGRKAALERAAAAFRRAHTADATLSDAKARADALDARIKAMP